MLTGHAFLPTSAWLVPVGTIIRLGDDQGLVEALLHLHTVGTGVGHVGVEGDGLAVPVEGNEVELRAGSVGLGTADG